eukprot:TRINITY_DN5126_c0_g1_i1.p1 TRINITY_DN5126_c0_g1~~TRINITY_DN5126_c0_g1_i1.p1  ORF type:complete len:103 (+),score=22.68 TRINITY_DN5126_c0_g1_i1:148-456(+)
MNIPEQIKSPHAAQNMREKLFAIDSECATAVQELLTTTHARHLDLLAEIDARYQCDGELSSPNSQPSSHGSSSEQESLEQAVLTSTQLLQTTISAFITQFEA